VLLLASATDRRFRAANINGAGGAVRGYAVQLDAQAGATVTAIDALGAGVVADLTSLAVRCALVPIRSTSSRVPGAVCRC
jgi:hypothetical protein